MDDYPDVETLNHCIGILVADTDGKHYPFESSPVEKLPHLIGLYVREGARGRGVASELIHGFMKTVDEDACVVDCAQDVMPFYEQLDCNVIYARPLKSGVDADRYHELLRADESSRNTSASPQHEVPFFVTPEDKHRYYENQPDKEDKPAIHIEAYDYPLGRLSVQMPHLPSESGRSYHLTLTEPAVNEINRVLETYEDCARIREFTSSEADFFYFPEMLPENTRCLADELYPILTNQSNLEPEERVRN